MWLEVELNQDIVFSCLVISCHVWWYRLREESYFLQIITIIFSVVRVLTVTGELSLFPCQITMLPFHIWWKAYYRITVDAVPFLISVSVKKAVECGFCGSYLQSHFVAINVLLLVTAKSSREMSEEIKPLTHDLHELSVHKGCLFWGNFVIIPDGSTVILATPHVHIQ